MDRYDDDQELVFALYDGYIIQITEKAVGIGPKPYRPGKPSPKMEMWLPKSQIHNISYGDGDSKEYKKGKRIEAVCIPRWLAKKKGLEEDE